MKQTSDPRLEKYANKDVATETFVGKPYGLGSFTSFNDTTYIAAHPYDASNWKDQIAAQKWVALYNQGLQSWFERNRLDFKNPVDGSALFVAPSITVDPTVSFVPFRLRYPLAEKSTNGVNYEQAASAVDGDQIGTGLWWQP